MLAVVPLVALLLGYRARDFLLLGAVLLPPLYPSRLDLNDLTIAGTTFTLILGVMFAIPAIFFWMGFYSDTRRLASPAMRGILISLTALLAVFALSITVHVGGVPDIIRGFHALCLVVAPFAAAWTVIRALRVDPTTVGRIGVAFFVGGVVISIFSIITALAPWMLAGIVASEKTEAETGRAFTPVGGPAGTAICLLLVYCLATGFFMARRYRALSFAVLALCFVGMLTTLARAAALVFVVANAYLFLRYWRGMGRRLAILAAIGMCAVVPLTIVLSQRYSLERLSPIGSPTATDYSIRLRAESLKTAIWLGTNNLALGGGWGLVYPMARAHIELRHALRPYYFEGHITAIKPHNLYALVFAEGGAVALLLLLVFFWRLWRALRPPDAAVDPQGHSIVHGFRAGLLSFIVISAMQDHLFLTVKMAFFFYLFVFAGLVINSYYRARAAGGAAVPGYAPSRGFLTTGGMRAAAVGS